MTFFRIALGITCFSAVLFAVSCRNPKVFPAPETVTLKNKHMECEVVAPSSAFNRGILGSRFMKAGWIHRLALKQLRYKVIREKSLWPTYPAFGCPQEFEDGIPLEKAVNSRSKELKIGVGVISANLNSPHHPDIIEYFPWTCQLRHDNGKTVLESRQQCKTARNLGGYGYDLKQTVTISEHGKNIVLAQTLKNTGSKRIRTRNYLHPFFIRNAFSSVLLKPRGWLKIKDMDGDHYLVKLNGECSKVKLLLDRKISCVISSDRYFSELKVWSDSRNDVFAVEPYIDINVPCGNTFSWYWKLSFFDKRKDLQNE